MVEFDDDDSALAERLRTSSFTRCAIYDAPHWYDTDYAGYRAEEPFYRLLAQRHVRAGALVEIGAGTGRLALALARDAAPALRVHAVEPAAAMRARLEQRIAGADADVRARVTVEAARAHDFAGPAEAVDLAVFAFNGLLHLATADDVRAAFAHVRERISDGGRFAFDVTAPYWEAIAYTPVSWGRSDERTDPASGRRVLTCDRSRYDAVSRLIEIEIRYLRDGDDAGVQVTLQQRMWTAQELLALLEASGFAVELVFGDVDLSPLVAGSPRLLVSARRA